MDGVYSLFFLPHKKQGLIVGNHHNINSLVVNTTQYIAMAVCVHFSDVFDMRSDWDYPGWIELVAGGQLSQLIHYLYNR